MATKYYIKNSNTSSTGDYQHVYSPTYTYPKWIYAGTEVDSSSYAESEPQDIAKLKKEIELMREEIEVLCETVVYLLESWEGPKYARDEG